MLDLLLGVGDDAPLVLPLHRAGEKLPPARDQMGSKRAALFQRIEHALDREELDEFEIRFPEPIPRARLIIACDRSGEADIVASFTLHQGAIAGRLGEVHEFFENQAATAWHEEIVNFAETTCNSALVQREAGYDVRFAAAIASYDQPRARDRLRETDLELIELLTIKRMLDSLEERGTFAPHLIASWREFLAGPVEWQNKRGIIPNTKQEVQHG
jgi:hypothetical protein